MASTTVISSDFETSGGDKVVVAERRPTIVARLLSVPVQPNGMVQVVSEGSTQLAMERDSETRLKPLTPTLDSMNSKSPGRHRHSEPGPGSATGAGSHSDEITKDGSMD